jgi:hypothetical protein
VQAIKAYASSGATWEIFLNYVTFGVISPFMSDATATVLAKQISDFFALTKPAPYQDQDLADLMYDFGRTQPHSRMVIVGHSQGNLYANLVYDKLTATGGIKPAKSIGMVGVAVPTLSVRSGNHHVTSSNDMVVDTARKALPAGAIIAPNITIPFQIIDPLGHNFIAIYLANSTVRTTLRKLIDNEFVSLRTTAPDPNLGVRVRAYSMQCGSLPYPNGPAPHSCYIDVPAGAPYQWHANVSINFWNNPSIPAQQHTYGTAAELDPLNRTYMTACYAWWIADRKAVIKSLGYVPTSGYYYPYHLHAGSCGAGFPWQTPYGVPDRAWAIYSADKSTTNSKSWVEGFVSYNDIEKWPVCLR